jgi:hypothetical protein
MGALAPGAVIGNCRIEGVVGQGGMGVVYRARQLDLDREVALKVVAPALTADPEARARFLAEARAAAAVEHPAVVPVHGAGEHDDAAYLVMRFVAGDDLRTLVRRDGPLAPDRAACVCERLGDALDAIHRAGYVHRDVKPQNVLLDEEGHVYLSDFGLAKAMDATRGPTDTDHWVGTLDYVSPEQVRGKRAGARSDVYALGGVLHFMLTGRVPYPRDSDEARLWAQLHEPPPRPSAVAPDVPAAFDGVVAGAMAKDPELRYESASALARAARAAADGEAPTAVLPRPRRRRRRLRIWPAATALAAAAAAAVLLLPRADDKAGPGASPSPTPGATATPAVSPPVVGRRWDDVGHRPRGVVVAAGGVFVISHDRNELVWIDAQTGRRKDAEPIGSGASSIVADGDDLWISRERGEVVHMDARTGKVVGRITVAPRARRLAVTVDGLWVATESSDGSDSVVEYSRTGTMARTVPFQDNITAMTQGGNFVWVATATRRLVRVGSDSVTPYPLLRAPAEHLSYAAGKVWASVPEREAVEVIDARTKDVSSEFLPGADEITLWRGRAFVARSLFHRVTVRGRRSRDIKTPKGPYAAATGAGHVWVACIESDALVRIDW